MKPRDCKELNTVYLGLKSWNYMCKNVRDSVQILEPTNQPTRFYDRYKTCKHNVSGEVQTNWLHIIQVVASIGNIVWQSRNVHSNSWWFANKTNRRQEILQPNYERRYANIVVSVTDDYVNYTTIYSKYAAVHKTVRNKL